MVVGGLRSFLVLVLTRGLNNFNKKIPKEKAG